MPSFGHNSGVAQLAAARAADLRGKVVLVDFWTYSASTVAEAYTCAPWAAKYKVWTGRVGVTRGVRVRENIDNVRRAVKAMDIITRS
jgi:hypothetical protein